MNRLVRKNILAIKPYVPGRPIEEVERELGLKGVVKMASNENALGPSPKALSAIRKTLQNLNRYPDGACFYLKEKLAKKLGVKREDLIIGNGSDEIIVLATRTFLEKGDEVIIAQPTFLIYEIASQIADAKIKFVPLKNYRYDLKSMKKAITPKTKMVFIANPDNPTGTYVTRGELDEFYKGLLDSLIVFLDEAYYEFAKDIDDFPDGLDYVFKKNTILARTFSKAFGLSGLRLGYGITRPELIGYMEKVRDPFNVNILAQAAGISALDDNRFLKRTVNFANREKGFIYDQIGKMGLRCVPSATNFILIDTGRDSKAIFNKLLKKGVIVRAMTSWGIDSFIRVTVGKRQENIRFIKALRSVL